MSTNILVLAVIWVGASVVGALSWDQRTHLCSPSHPNNLYNLMCTAEHTITQTKKKDRHFWEYSGEVCSDLRSAGKPVALNTSVTSIAVFCLFVCLLHHLHCSLACDFAHLISRCIWSAAAVLSASCRQSKPISVHCGGWRLLWEFSSYCNGAPNLQSPLLYRSHNIAFAYSLRRAYCPRGVFFRPW